MDTFLGILFALGFLGGMISIPHLFIIKRELRSNGIRASYLWWLPSDILKFKTLIKNEKNPVKKQAYLSTYYFFLIPFIVALLAFIAFGAMVFLS
ncbi:MAG: hypothetical protein M0Q90_11125 [Bacteroidales bacterium]|nr:hypothetical protein [Bacteroidales bacterium]